MTAEPLSYPVLVADVPAGGRRYHFDADAQSLSQLAEMLGIPAVPALRAEFEVRPAHGGAFRVRGKVVGSVVQTDVVTLEPVEQAVDEEVDLTLVSAQDAGGGRRRAREELVDAAEPDGPDLFHDDRIDLGIIAREHLALGLDPYPRAPDSDFSGYIEDDTPLPSPFAALKSLKERGE